MKNQARNLGALAAVAMTLVVAGCASTKEVFVNEAPPPPQQETVSTPVHSSDVWQAGHWVRRDNQWAWQNGHWMLRPGSRAYWEPGRWDQTSRGWIWHEGQWRDIAAP